MTIRRLPAVSQRLDAHPPERSDHAATRTDPRVMRQPRGHAQWIFATAGGHFATGIGSNSVSEYLCVRKRAHKAEWSKKKA